jgi:hypothetical protein
MAGYNEAVRTWEVPLILPALAIVEVAGAASRLRDAGRSALVVALLTRLANVVPVPHPVGALSQLQGP